MNTIAQDSAALLAPTNSVIGKDAAALVGRILLATIFILSGVSKLGAVDGTIGYITSVGLPFAGAIFYAVVALEIAGGFALAFGIKPRLIAASLGAFSIMAAVIFHSDFSDQNQMIHFLKNVAIAGGLFQVVAFGPGRLAISRN
ncbi:MAG: DoxX family protein [Pseudomonadota bacterium]